MPEEEKEAEPRLSHRTEVRLIKAISKVFPEPREAQEPAHIMRALARGKDLTLLDPVKIAAIRPKNGEAIRILTRFYNPNIEHRTINPELCQDGAAVFDSQILKDCLNIFSCFESKEVSITTGREKPIRLENQYFIVYLAPRINSPIQ